MTNEVTTAGVGNRFLPKNCCEIISNKFNLDSNVELETGQVSSTAGFIRPTGGTAAGTPYNFDLPPVADTFLQMNSMYFYIKCKIQKADGTSLTATDSVGLVNGFGLSFFEEIQVFLNGFKISQDTDVAMPYKNMIETQLSYEGDAKETHLTTNLFKMDTTSAMEDFDYLNGSNTGFKTRSSTIQLSKEFDFTVPLCTDFTRADNHLAPGSTLGIVAKQNSTPFLIKSNSDDAAFKIIVQDIRLYYNRIRLDPKLTAGIVQKPHRYLTARTQLLHRALAQGLHSFHTELFRGALPRTVVVCQVKSSAFGGRYKENPYNFQHFKVNDINLRLNGLSIPSDAYECDFDNNLVMRAYTELFINTGTWRNDRGACVSLERFKKGSTFFCWDLTPDRCNSYHLHNSRSGVLDLEMTWKTPLEQPTTILIYAVFNQRITANVDNKMQNLIEVI